EASWEAVGPGASMGGRSRAPSLPSVVSIELCSLTSRRSAPSAVKRAVHTAAVLLSCQTEDTSCIVADDASDDSQDHNVTISILATDCHPAVQKMLREDHKSIKHELWHIVKGVKKRMLQSRNTELKEHEKMLKCEHEPYSEEDGSSRPWLERSSKAFGTLQKVVMDKRLLKKLDKVTEGIYTGELESIHSLYTKYVPKRKKFTEESFQARLAALDHNHNIDREQAQTKKGALQFKLQYSKPAGGYVVKAMKTPKSYNFRREIMDGCTMQCAGGSLTLRALRLLDVQRRVALGHVGDRLSLRLFDEQRGAVSDCVWLVADGGALRLEERGQQGSEQDVEEPQNYNYTPGEFCSGY
ncbi:hypothetical protein KUCAC02_030379, partial [Chaenocephalus aceratus]